MEKKKLINQKVLRTRIKQLAAEITKDYEGETLTLICILKGSLYFFADLSRRINLDTELEFIRVSSYEGENTTGKINMLLDLDKPITNKNVIVVEDIIDTGKTLSYLLEYLQQQKPKSLRLCTLLDKPERRETEVHVDYVGFTIPNHFVIGYGLDLDQKYRNLPEINCFIEKEQKEQLKEDKDVIKLQLKQHQQDNKNGNRH